MRLEDLQLLPQTLLGSDRMVRGDEEHLCSLTKKRPMSGRSGCFENS